MDDPRDQLLIHAAISILALEAQVARLKQQLARESMKAFADAMITGRIVPSRSLMQKATNASSVNASQEWDLRKAEGRTKSSATS